MREQGQVSPHDDPHDCCPREVIRYFQYLKDNEEQWRVSRSVMGKVLRAMAAPQCPQMSKMVTQRNVSLGAIGVLHYMDSKRTRRLGFQQKKRGKN